MSSAQNLSKKQYPCDIAPLMNRYVKVSRLIKLNWSKKKGDHAQVANNPIPTPSPPNHLFTMTEISTAKLWVSSVTWESSQADKGSLASFNNSY